MESPTKAERSHAIDKLVSLVQQRFDCTFKREYVDDESINFSNDEGINFSNVKGINLSLGAKENSAEVLKEFRDRGDFTFVLGLAHVFGEKVISDIKQDCCYAYAWFTLALDARDEDAQEALNNLEILMSCEQIKKANDMANEWRK